jgi:putative cell wall-binding protein
MRASGLRWVAVVTGLALVAAAAPPAAAPARAALSGERIEAWVPTQVDGAAQPEDTWRQVDAAPWRDRRGRGVHESFGAVRWWQGSAEVHPADPAPGRGPRHALLDGLGKLVVEVAPSPEGQGRVAAIDTDDGSIAWLAQLPEAGAARCFGVGEDGTVWAQGHGGTLYGLDNATGAVIATYAIPSGPVSPRCEGEAGLLFLPGNRLLFSQFCRIRLVDLDDGSVVWTAPACFPEPAGGPLNPRLLAASRDLATVYTVGHDSRGDGVRIVAVDAATGDLRASVPIPGRVTLARNSQWLVDADGGIVIALPDRSGRDGGRDNAGFLVRVTDDGTDLALDWVVEFAEGDGLIDGWAPQAVTLGGADGDLVALALGGASLGFGARDPVVGVEVVGGDVRWIARPLSGHLTADAAGNILTLHHPLRTTYPPTYTVLEPLAGSVIGTGPQRSMVTPRAPHTIGPDGTLYTVADLPGQAGERWVALDAAAAPAVPVTVAVFPAEVGAARSTVEIAGPAVRAATRVLVRRGGQEREAEVIPRPTMDRIRASFDLSGAELGDWEVVVTGPHGSAVAPLRVVAAEPAKRIAVNVSTHAGIRTGRQTPAFVSVRNLSNIDANAVPVIVAFDGLPEDTAFDVRPPGGPPAVPDGAPPGFTFDDIPLVPRVGDTFYFVGLLPILSPGQEVTIRIDLTIPRREGVDGEGRITARVIDCLLTNDRRPAPWLTSGDPSNAGFGRAAWSSSGWDVAACLGSVVSQIKEGALGALVESSGVGCVINVIIGHPWAIADAATQNWTSFAWFFAGTALQCLIGFAAKGPAGALLGAAVGVLGSVLFSCGILEAVRRFAFGASHDPNEIIGPQGVGGDRWLTARGAMGYTVYFENLPEATFPAAVVRITHTLDEALDPATFRLGSFGWGRVVEAPPPGVGQWETLISPPDVDDLVVAVSVVRAGRDVTFVLRAIDPQTGQEPEDGSAGFLPPNREDGRGEGFVSFTVDPAEPLLDGAVVEAQASIVFDDNPPIVTNIWSNTFDLIPPTTGIDGPAVEGYGAAFALGGHDATSGIAGWQIERLVEAGRFAGVHARSPSPSYQLRIPRGEQATIRVAAIDGAGNVSADPVTATAAVPADTVERVAGQTRIHTAVEVSRHAFPVAAAVVIARADLYPDALAGAPLAYHLGGPILLTDRDELPPIVLAEIRRLQAHQAVVLGGQAAVGAAVEEALVQAGLQVTRVAGSDRFATAAEIARLLPAQPRAFLVEGAHVDPARGWPDALAVAPWAARAGAPVLLAIRDRLPPPTAALLQEPGFGRVTLVGGTAALGDDVADAVRALGVDVDRVAGPDRYRTSLAVADAAAVEGRGGRGETWLATGLAFPDALTAAPAVALARGQLLLIHGGRPAGAHATLERVRRDRPQIRFLYLVGGPAAISEPVETAVRDVLGG